MISKVSKVSLKGQIGILESKRRMTLNFLFKILLTINATSWMLVVYWIKEGVILWTVPHWLFSMVLLCMPIILSAISIWISKFLGSDSLSGCQEFSLADNEFLPTYLG